MNTDNWNHLSMHVYVHIFGQIVDIFNTCLKLIVQEHTKCAIITCCMYSHVCVYGTFASRFLDLQNAFLFTVVHSKTWLSYRVFTVHAICKTQPLYIQRNIPHKLCYTHAIYVERSMLQSLIESRYIRDCLTLRNSLW